MVPFAQYAKVADNFCFAYNGLSPEYAVQLDYIVPVIRRTYPDINVSLYVSDVFLSLTTNASPYSQIRPNEFGHFKEFHTNPKQHTVLEFLVTANLTFDRLITERTGPCMIFTKSTYPAKPLTQIPIEGIIDPPIEAIDQASWVVGAENECVFLAAARGIRTTLIASGDGAEVFRTLFPHGEVWNLN